MADLGDLGGFLKEGNIPNLDWLEVNEEDYRKLDTLPKQNLDVLPDLEAAWSHTDTPASKLIPNRQGLPRTMGDLSTEHGLLRASPDDIRKVARLSIIRSSDANAVKDTLTSRFDQDSLVAARTVLAEVMEERGLLGRLYINSADFPTCSATRTAGEFVRKFASEAKYVIRKTACDSCACAMKAGGKDTCSIFHKELIPDVVYTEGLASEIESKEAAKGKLIQASGAPKGRIKRAYLATTSSTPGSAAYQGVGQQVVRVATQEQATHELISAEALLRKKAQHVEVATAKPVVSFVRRELLKGRTASEVEQSLQTVFVPGVLNQTKAHWEPLLREAGLFGAVYTTQDSFDDCREGADFLAKHGAQTRVVVAGDKCESCIYKKVGRCLLYGRPLVASAEAAVTPEMVQSVITDHKMAGRIAPWDSRLSWGDTPADALRSLHTAATHGAGPTRVSDSVFRAFSGARVTHQTPGLVKQEIVKQASRYMNEGLYGDDLLVSLKSKYEVRDIVAAQGELRSVLAEQGLQGIYFVDPTVYEDYGKGCKEASRLHRTRQVPVVRMGSKCGSCVHQTNPGFCSVIHKPLVAEVRYPQNKTALQREILASGRSTEVAFESLVNNGLSMMAEYQMQHTANVDINPQVAIIGSLDIEFGGGSNLGEE